MDQERDYIDKVKGTNANKDQSKGTNINNAKSKENGKVKVRTYIQNIVDRMIQVLVSWYHLIFFTWMYLCLSRY